LCGEILICRAEPEAAVGVMNSCTGCLEKKVFSLHKIAGKKDESLGASAFYKGSDP